MAGGMVLPPVVTDELVLTTRPTGGGAGLASRLAAKMDPLLSIVLYLQLRFCSDSLFRSAD